MESGLFPPQSALRNGNSALPACRRHEGRRCGMLSEIKEACHGDETFTRQFSLLIHPGGGRPALKPEHIIDQPSPCLQFPFAWTQSIGWP